MTVDAYQQRATPPGAALSFIGYQLNRQLDTLL